MICDEPTGNLDPETSKDIMRILLEINRHGTTTVVVTHDMNIVKLLNKRVLTLEDGRLTGDSSKGGIVNV